MNTLTITGQKPGQYNSRTVLLTFADGTTTEKGFPNASSQGTFVKRNNVVAVSYDLNPAETVLAEVTASKFDRAARNVLFVKGAAAGLTLTALGKAAGVSRYAVADAIKALAV